MDKHHRIVFAADYGVETPLHYRGPYLPESFGLSPDLCLQLESWASLFDHAVGDDAVRPWKHGFDSERYENEGDQLARCVADELGSRWAVQRRRAWAPDSESIWIRSTEPGSREGAESAAEPIAERAKQQEERLRAIRDRGGKLDIAPRNGRSALPPRSGS